MRNNNSTRISTVYMYIDAMNMNEIFAQTIVSRFQFMTQVRQLHTTAFNTISVVTLGLGIIYDA